MKIARANAARTLDSLARVGPLADFVLPGRAQLGRAVQPRPGPQSPHLGSPQEASGRADPGKPYLTPVMFVA